jgi:RluA family pseudouridine synthase
MSATFFTNSPESVIGWGRGWLVMNKHSGMSIHNDPGKDLCSVLNRFLQTHPEEAQAVAFDAGYGIHPVHRLDKETSGVILLSCRRDVFDSLSRQFAQGTVIKHYLALVHGHAAAKGSDCWQWALTPKAAGRRNPKGSGRRIPCRTHVRLLRHSKHYSLIACQLDTGRTHQIRRHAALAGHPLVGDRRYGSLRACRHLEKHHDFKRLALHAAGLSFQPPGDSESRLFEVPVLPWEIRHLLDADG